jgi:DNA polymerase III epsilon subunit-like protein
MTRLLVVDTETGGVDPQIHSILSLAAVVWDDGKILAEFEVLIAEPVLAVTARALEINGIDLVEHCKQAVAPIGAWAQFQSFLWQNLTEELASAHKITLVGHNVNFDVGFMKRLFRLTGVAFEDVFSHRVIDTAGLLRFLTLAQRLKLSGASSTEAFESFGIAVPKGRRHTALGDARATAQLLSKLIDVVR